ncbi:MAG: YolD-like family protein [Ruminococcaceae bacterium]|nr:YolD-like family protein [Oscillospiraceae bacterium]
MTKKFPYEDIINIPRHVSPKYSQPTMMDRAARFHPFAAIDGYEEMVLEEARVTEDYIELEEGTLALLNKKLNIIQNFIDKKPTVKITYFEPDDKKSGGAYINITGTVKCIDKYKQLIIMSDGKKIKIKDIYNIESDLFYSQGLED